MSTKSEKRRALAEIIDDLTVRLLELRARRRWLTEETNKIVSSKEKNTTLEKQRLNIQKRGLLSFVDHRLQLEELALSHNRNVFLLELQNRKEPS